MQKSNSCVGVIMAVVLGLGSQDVSAQLALKIGIDTFGSHDIKSDFPLKITEAGLRGSVLVDKTTDANPGLMTGLEFLLGGSRFKIGGSLEYQLPRELKDINGNFGFLSLYTLTKITLPLPFEAYVTGRFGLNLLRGDANYKSTKYAGVHPVRLGTATKFLLEPGYGFGAGIPISRRYFIEAIYSVNKSTRRYDGAALDRAEKTVRAAMDYSIVTLTFGYIL